MTLTVSISLSLILGSGTSLTSVVQAEGHLIEGGGIVFEEMSCVVDVGSRVVTDLVTWSVTNLDMFEPCRIKIGLVRRSLQF